MTIVQRISLLAAFSTLLFVGATSPAFAEDAVQQPAGQEVKAAEAAADPASSADGPGCPFAGSGPCCAECQGKLAEADAGEQEAGAPAGCPCQRARQLQLQKQQEQQRAE